MRRGVYTIPSGTGFLKHLAAGLMQMTGGDESALIAMRVLLPTRRAGRELRDAFLDMSQGKPLLLPRIQPIGDVDAEEVDLYLSGFSGTGHDIPPAISGLERKFLLSSLVRAKDQTMGMDAALSLAGDLASLIDTVHTEDLDFSGLKKIVPDDLSDHWKQTLEFLDIITDAWPQILAERGQIDPADRRNRLLKSLASLWRDYPPATPIIAAGSTGSIPAAGELLKVIANLPQGIVILPGLDLELEDDSWENITDTHPQATMKNVLQRMEITRADVRVWPESERKKSKRDAFLRALMRPAETFGTVNFEDIPPALDHLTIIEAANAREEAAVIALALREVLENPERTACFVTPDRTLARRVMTALHRWNIKVDDSAGGALATTAGATFLVSLIRVIEENFSPLSLLDFLKHDYQKVIQRDDLYTFERRILRGARPAPGLEGLRHRATLSAGSADAVHPIIDVLEHHFDPLIKIRNQESRLDQFCIALMQVAENFAGGKQVLWSHPESDALSGFISNVMGYADLVPAMTFDIFGDVFRELLTAEKYRADNEPHRRILILGQLESRLIYRDVMILGGLNEGVWPRDPGHDPWMSRPMRKKFGLPSPERSAGLAAHDFVEHVSAEKVILTRSLKADGTSTVPARWLQKFRTLLKAAGQENLWANGHQYLDWVRKLDDPAAPKPAAADVPAPCPPREFRPQTLSATTIEKWMKNPYRLYAEKILKLKRIDPVDADKVHAERGSFVHDVLLDFVRQYPHAELPENAKEIILEIAKERRDAMEHVALHWHYWWPRFERLIDWFVAEETKWRQEAMPWIQEETGQLQIYHDEKSGRHFTVTARADRIDRIKAGGVAVLDYKTGTPPALYKVKDGTAPQLPIESLILAKGGFRKEPVEPKTMRYWKLSGSYSLSGEVIDRSKTLAMDDVIAATEDGLSKLVEKFEDPSTPYIARSLSGKLYDDDMAYAHLARTSEWSSGGSDDEDDTGGALDE